MSNITDKFIQPVIVLCIVVALVISFHIYKNQPPDKQIVIVVSYNKLIDPYKGICEYGVKTLDNQYRTINDTCCMHMNGDTILIDSKNLK